MISKNTALVFWSVLTLLLNPATALGSKTYIVRTILDPILVEHAAQTEEEILEEEAADQALLFPSQNQSDDEGDASDDDGERPSKFYGSLISWSKADQLGSVGLLYIILALVLASGRVVSDSQCAFCFPFILLLSRLYLADLRRHLKTLHIPSNPNLHPIQHTDAATTRSLNLDAYLGNLLRQGYLDRQEVGGDAAGKKKKGGGVKRLRTQAEDMDEGRTYEWRWGPRALVEAGEVFIATFVAEFMVDSIDGEDEVIERARRQELVKKMYSGLEKAAGGKLAELR